MLAILIPEPIAEALFWGVAACSAFLPSIVWRIGLDRGLTSHPQANARKSREMLLRYFPWAVYAALLIGVWQCSVSVHQIHQADDSSAFRESFILLGNSFDYHFRDGRTVLVRRHSQDHTIVINDSAQTIVLKPLQYSLGGYSPTPPQRPRTDIFPHEVFHFDGGIWKFGSEPPPKTISVPQSRPSEEQYWLEYLASDTETSSALSRLIPLVAGCALGYWIHHVSTKRLTNRRSRPASAS